ncbi:MAG: 30S ribosomal protein S8 [Zetaproteobacteria bacterium CG12_big_fil_rev_8_21_14_0_65_54_13]|nr:MAG: 30S ribosomal protein S8 [Zetaproteobacteria bacterium CG23_combo_of_CG06-09_8_20_14_all_54_7]PIW49121.1 MAG: 30S ribosomal protein S8 [Zetaproteobacteria bacterium CG12_big_fil_rev_8_21_14_0_65_54_13]PIX55908.1 MAG: 30S ribosomal protein S8 [Zetaproteobacteria bacterium CG_4_10_14_3_um_filter_54_28]PJA30504.1 MAG: 30S ribosomal protein S8 [Zetaproteobacteria bacterium CG_4_9_14_3_um_filter_54_145]
MMMDRIADMLTRIRNAQMAGIERIEMPASKVLLAMAELLKDEGYLGAVKAYNHKGHRFLRVTLRYDEDAKPIIHEIKRISKSGRRVYVGVDELPRVKNGYGVALISTSKGIMTDRTARTAQMGGEVLCTVF